MIEKSTTPYVYNDSNYKRVQYTRYADDFIIGVIGSKADAEADVYKRQILCSS